MAGISDIIGNVKGFVKDARENWFAPKQYEGGDDPEYMKLFNFFWEKGYDQQQIDDIIDGKVDPTEIVPSRTENLSEPFTGAKGGIVGYEGGGTVMTDAEKKAYQGLLDSGYTKDEAIKIIELHGSDYSGLQVPEFLTSQAFKAKGGIVDVLESLRPRMAGGGTIMDYTRGGHAVGPGTATSDSIPAFLSDGEFVMTNKAVKGFGGGNREQGAQKLYGMMKKAEASA